MRARPLLAVVALTLGITPAAGAGPSPVAQDRSVEPVVLRGAQFPAWSAGPDPTAREPGAPVNYDTGDLQPTLGPLASECYRGADTHPNPYDYDDNGDHNCYQSSRLPRTPLEGEAVDRILGYRWNGTAFEQIPFQVDERFTRYISNNYSDFAFYSVVDAHNTYAFDREGFRYTWDGALAGDGHVCEARPHPSSTIVNGLATTPDPVKGLDDDDELVFMWSDAAAQAPAGTPLPAGIDSAFEVAVADPSDPSNVTFAYVMLARPDGPVAAFDSSNGYVRYQRDANTIPPDPSAPPSADMFVYSQSSYDGYGAAPKGPYCTLDGTVSTTYREADDKPSAPEDPLGRAIEQRRPIDTAWIKTPRYWFRYEGRWLMTQLRISPDDSGLAGSPALGPDIIDQWKARAFQQRPGGQTPCCGYEEEVNNWGGSSILMGERAGPVRAIRATWGADSSTNNIRIETFYRDEIRFGDSLRVHVIPPFDGIYVQWDYNAGRVGTYYNPWNPEGVAVDGKDDESVGNSYLYVAGDRVEARDGDQHVSAPLPGGNPGGCDLGSEDGICNDVDSPDPTFSGPLGSLNWEEIAGPNGSVVTRWTIKEHTGGDGYSLAALPYYRDDSCFDDGTGSDPGPHLRSRNVDNGAFAEWLNPATGQTEPRRCWDAATDGIPPDDPALARQFWQGDIGTHGLHLQLIADSDNAALTAPVDEIVSEQRMVVLAGDPGNVGERYGRGTVEFPLQATARPIA